MRKIVIGDVHGCYEELKTLLEKVNFDKAQDKVIFLGDYLDRGPEPVKVFELIKSLKEEMGDRCVLLYGNHEDMMNEWCEVEHQDEEPAWTHPMCYNGGRETIEKLMENAPAGKTVEEVVGEYCDWFLQNTEKYYSDEEMYCVHATPLKDPETMIKKYGRDAIYYMIWNRDQFHKEGRIGTYNGKLAFVGHTPICDRPVFAINEQIYTLHCDMEYPLPDRGIIDLDTACVYDGFLTAAIVENGKFTAVQVKRAASEQEEENE